MATPPFTIDEANPSDSYIIANYPAIARDYRDNVKSWIEVEHALSSGRHEFGIGLAATRDAITTWTDGAFWVLKDPSATNDRPVLQVYDSGASPEWEDASLAALQIFSEWIKTQYGRWVTITIAASSLTPDLSESNFFKAEATTNFTLENGTNKPGLTGPLSSLPGAATWLIEITQDGTGGNTISFGTDYVFAYGTAPQLTPDALAVDILVLTLRSDGKVHVELQPDSQ